MTWPQGALMVDVPGLLQEGLRLNAGAETGQPVTRAAQERAMAVVDALAAYLGGLPDKDQPLVARKLVSALSGRPRFTPTVAPRTRA